MSSERVVSHVCGAITGKLVGDVLVGLVARVNSLMVFSRTRLMIMTLCLGVSTGCLSATVKPRKGSPGAYVRNTDKEHHAAHQLLLPVQIQCQQLRERQRQQPNVKGNARRGSYPSENVDVDALALVLALPLRPKVRDGCALEDDGEQEAEVVDDVEGHGELQDAAKLVVGPRREDSEVEEDDGGADEEAGQGVEDHLGEEHLGEGEKGQRVGREKTGVQVVEGGEHSP